MEKEIIIVVQYNEQNKTYNISLDKNTTIKELEMQFRDQLSINPKATVSFYCQKQILKRDLTLSEQCVVKGSKLDLVVEHKGG